MTKEKFERRQLENANILSMYKQGMKYKDIASIMEMSVGRVGMIIQRLRQEGSIHTGRYYIPGFDIQQNQSRVIDGYDVPMNLYGGPFPHYKVIEYYNNTNLSYPKIGKAIGHSAASVFRSVRRLRKYGLISTVRPENILKKSSI